MSNKMVCQTNTTFRSLHLPMSLFTISEDANHNYSSSSTSTSTIYQAFESPLSLSLSPVFRSSNNTNPLCFREEDDDKDDQDEYDRISNSHAIVVAALNIVKETNTMTHEESEEEEYEQHLAACPHNSSSSSSSSSRWEAACTTCASERNSSFKMPSPSISRRRTRRNSMPLRRVSLSSSRSSSGVDRPPTCPVRRGRSGRTRNFEPVAASVSRKRIRRNSIPSRCVSLSSSSSSRSSVVDRPPTCPIRRDSSHKTRNFKPVAASVA
ncbi:hypothetical protein FRACYDRAFT_236499 [Fragilariopsis cylindrus CCMP1102]|uniref:Uncharacterized protein n=1 Tax=Fragilariopsis cylindrus CCMP1102 TaxID=635003 RepID=A0A1E7FJA2_9STRA|nr:hypothetical protein FRACYDRAFT_236499 [Fragilariopsis cylindrus CCMP1102]|eukprot:OEU18228.1 hypothetical protein FRACYDRAFT_236499 [Fragilariopsis cylindrus CCMP1102]